MEQSIARSDLQLVDTGVASPHEAVDVELPVLVAIRAEPLIGMIAKLISEPNGNAVFRERPKLLDEAIIVFQASSAARAF